MKLKELLNNKINGHYQELSSIIKTSEWGLEQIIIGNGEISLDNLQILLDNLGISIHDDKKEIKYELSTEINNKIFKYYASYWLKNKKYEVRESTYANYINLFTNNIIPYLGNIECDSFNSKLLQMWVYWCKDKGGKEGNGISEHYIRDCLNLVKAVIREGQQEKIFPDFSIGQIKIPKTLQIENQKQVYSEKEYKKIINYILDNISSKSVGILIGIYTGIRIGELCALKWNDIDFEENTIRINKTIQRIYNPLDEIEPSKIIITPCKTQTSIRDIPISKDLRKILKTIKNEDDNCYVLSNSKNPIEPRTYRKFYVKFMKNAGIEPIKFHALRHTFASINIENGVDVKTISEILGHSNVDITLKVYTHTSQKAKEKAINKFNAMFRTQTEKIEFTSKYRGNICCIRKKNNKLDFIGAIKEVSEYLGVTSKYICDVINGIKDDDVYSIIPQIEGITHKNGVYVGG